MNCTITITKDLMTLANIKMHSKLPSKRDIPVHIVLLCDINWMVTANKYSAYVTDHDNDNKVSTLIDFLDILKKRG